MHSGKIPNPSGISAFRQGWGALFRTPLFSAGGGASAPVGVTLVIGRVGVRQ